MFFGYTFSESRFGDPIAVAYEMKNRIKEELGFTVNIGVSCNKLLAKMGSELKKPDWVHTLYPHEGTFEITWRACTQLCEWY